VKEFLSQKGIPYVDRDISTDELALEELEAMGYLTTPVVKVDDEIVVGFNRKRLDELLST
jgi:glutaredoxin